MKAQDRIDQLNKEITAARAEQDRCQHSWSPTVRDTRYRKKGYGHKQDGAGSDPHWGYEGYQDVPYTIYTRTCNHCGLKQETDKTEVKATGYTTIPIF